ncbi:MAG: choice-of-anchor J domain-containing protein, partial [Candidatus Delongbacteria bacterium]|nr:choice-of-anchor J domain-containing protein [Candidatus Delongbacteria bacterium]
MISTSYFNDVIFDTLMIMTDDFYISIVPDENGMPRQVSSYLTGSSHSYVDSSGSWLPFYDENERYEWVTQVLFSELVDADIYPPIVRSLTGNKNFLDVDANLNLVVQDANNVLFPINAEYTIDDGMTWTSFTMIPAKSNYLFTGIITGQPDGTVGSVKFFLEDSLSNSQWSEEYPLSWSKDNMLLYEGFEGSTFPPNDWTMQIVDPTGIGFQQFEPDGLVSGVHSGSYSAYHHYGGATNFNDDWLITPLVSIPDSSIVSLSFWQLGYEMEYVSSGYHEIAVSTDMATWDVIYTGHPPFGASGNGEVWEKIILSLQAFAGQDVYIGFHYVGNYEEQWYIDDVELFFD